MSKKHFLKSLILTLIISAASIVILSTPTFAACPSGGGYKGSVLTVCDMNDVIRLVVTILNIIIGAAAVIGFVVAGIIYATSGGDESKIKNAKQWILNIVIGLVVYALMYSIYAILIPSPTPYDPDNPIPGEDKTIDREINWPNYCKTGYKGSLNAEQKATCKQLKEGSV